MKILARAKINLALHITDKMKNGYHKIETIVTFADFGDELHIKPHNTIKLNIKGQFGKYLNSKNSIMQAADALAPYSKGQGVEINLHKNLPLGAGMGGGSADAAATIHALCELWQLKLSHQQKMAIGKKLGADVPMCLHGSPLLAQGVGEEITPIKNMPAFHFVAVNCLQPLLSKNVFANLQKINNSSLPTLPKTNIQQVWFEYLKTCRNDMETTAIKLLPDIRHCIEALQKTPTEIVRLTGAGATVFALYNSQKLAQNAAMDIQQHNKNWWVKVGATI